MKALILAGGRGNRINEFSRSKNKCMVPLMGKPLIEYNLERIADENISEIIIVVGYKAEDIINYYGISFKNKRIRYVIQHEQKGLVHAIKCAGAVLEGENFFLMLGDEVMVGSRHKEMIRFFKENENLFGVCGILEVDVPDRIRQTYSIISDGQNRIFRLIEKPNHPINSFQGTGQCIFNNKILEYIDKTPIHYKRQEKELPDLIQSCIDNGRTVKSFLICDHYTNINSKEDLLAAEKLIKNISK